MRKFRNAALAGATAMALTFGGTSVAMAETEQQTPSNSSQAGTPENTSNSGSSLQHFIGKNIFQTDQGTEAKGEDIFGKKNWDDVPFSWKLLYGSTWALGIVAAIALVAGPIDNFIKYGPFAK
ncbi:hypothetical protein KBX10_02550 [Corynebacterium sp. CCUG 59401]|nr:hypothetical protein [Corynebacterium pseudogenitalium]